jgi:hypothetical protein
MSGIFTRPQYDDCYPDEYLKMNKPAYNYSFFLGYNVSPTMKTNMKACINNDNEDDKCFVCNLNNDATLDKTPENFMKITEIDNNLKGLNRNITYCNDKKFQGCFGNNNSDECKNNIIINPQLCNREVAPTNMKKFDNVLF